MDQKDTFCKILLFDPETLLEVIENKEPSNSMEFALNHLFYFLVLFNIWCQENNWTVLKILK